MQITDINDFISTAAQLLNAPDLILIAVLLANAVMPAIDSTDPATGTRAGLLR